MNNNNEVKNCPYCGEEILAVAKKCKHCGEWLTEEKSDVIQGAPKTQSEPNIQRSSVNTNTSTEVKSMKLNRWTIIIPVAVVLVFVLLISVLSSSGNKVNIVGAWDGHLTDYIALEKGKSEGVLVFGSCGEPESGTIAFNFKNGNQMEVAMILSFNKYSHEYIACIRLDGTYSLRGNTVSIQPRQLLKANIVSLNAYEGWLSGNGYTKEGLERSITSELSRMNMNPILQILSKKSLIVTQGENSTLILADNEGKQFIISQNYSIFK